MRGEAKPRVIESLERSRACRENFGKAIEIVDEAPLMGAGQRAAEAAMSVVGGDEREADAGLRGGGGDAHPGLGEISVRRAVGIVMEIVEFADARESGFEELGEKLRRDRFDVVR